ncbi:MAG: 7TM-DISM domain-containing protein [Oligoflexus sp.]
MSDLCYRFQLVGTIEVGSVLPSQEKTSMMMRWYTFLGMIFVVAELAMARSQNPENLLSGSYINSQASYFVDENDRSPEDVLSNRQEYFGEPATGVPHSLGVSDHTIWVLFEWEHSPQSPSLTKQIYFENNFPLIDHIDLYHFNEKEQLVEHLQAGDRYPFDSRNFRYRNPSFKITLEEGRNIFLFQIKTIGPATRYESMRKVIFRNNAQANVLVLQEAVFRALPKKFQAALTKFDLREKNLIVRDDPLADCLYYQTLASDDSAVPASTTSYQSVS